jgi:NAD(P)-dependent dehydrogenase (short-subunit alcohol dehydrogenase family)
MGLLDDKVVVVTGAGRGIGRGEAIECARQGAAVVLNEFDPAVGTSVVDEIKAAGGTAVLVEGDVSDVAVADELVAAAVREFGRLDGLVNNAGIGGGRSILADDEVVQQMITVNLLAPIRLMRAVVPIMRAQGAGAVVNIGSVAGEVGIGGTYSATKFALRGLTDSVRRELAGTGIGVTLVEPGFINTDLSARRRRGVPGPEVVAAAVERALRRPRRRIVVPRRYRAAITLSNALPFLTDRLYAGKAARRP